jgi:hypothetical protein
VHVSIDGRQRKQERAAPTLMLLVATATRTATSTLLKHAIKKNIPRSRFAGRIRTIAHSPDVTALDENHRDHCLLICD